MADLINVHRPNPLIRLFNVITTTKQLLLLAKFLYPFIYRVQVFHFELRELAKQFLNNVINKGHTTKLPVLMP